MTHCSSRKTSGLSAWEFPAFPFLTRIEGIFVEDERSMDWIPTCTEPLFVWDGFCFVLFCKMQTFSSFKLLQESKQALKENKLRGKYVLLVICLSKCCKVNKKSWLVSEGPASICHFSGRVRKALAVHGKCSYCNS